VCVGEGNTVWWCYSSVPDRVNNWPTGSGSGSLPGYQRLTENCLKRVHYFIKSSELVPMLQHIFSSGHKVVQLGSGSVIHWPSGSEVMSVHVSGWGSEAQKPKCLQVAVQIIYHL
jgi:hypothetical protein